MRILILFLCLTSGCFAFSLPAQDSLEAKKQEIKYASGTAPAPLKFDEEKLNVLKEQPAFDYSRDQEESWWDQFKRYISLKWHNFLEWLFGDYQANNIITFFLKILPYLIIGGVLIFAVWLFAKLNPGKTILGSKVQGGVFLSDEEEIIQSRDIGKLIKDALSSHNYRLAIRYHYLLLLQQFTEKELINYNFSKTDEDYLAEIEQGPIREQFRKLARIYDFVWYGNFETTANDFGKAEMEFSKMEHLIAEKDEQNL